MKRYCLALDLVDNQQLIAEYEHWHKTENAWPEIKKSITDSGITNMEIDRTGAPISDEANAGGTIVYGGTLNVTLLSAPATLQLGDNFDLFDAPSFFDVFTTINLPSLSGLGDGNWYWSNNLGTSGGIQVLPEPSSALMAGLAGLGLLARRRRA